MSDTTGDFDHLDPETVKQRRLEYPSGWLALCQYDSVHFIIDALLSASPRREFTKTELADIAGISTQSVRRHADRLVEFGVLTEVADGKRYRFDDDSPVGQLVIELNGALVATAQSDPADDEDTAE